MCEKNYLTHDLVVTMKTSFLKTSKVSFLWVSVKSVQWSFRVGSVELHKGSWIREIGDGWVIASN